ncbi:membrane protein [Enhydrobacter aerosaccus]|uniref:Membrane protein n=1 Tax=Enhydrobacter aerosaccus TaxID=225324 RepID=A0A1T4TKN6_9HYPH|nr:YhjD/YihY/BrkB family envelope integrity protein [Enhydrobacter aerosaccus]SKA41035.1 membrane protein [Enhydrobacter aerosaccus]
MNGTLLDKLWRIAFDSFTGFFTNRLSTSAAAMAFYTMFALGPIMIFSIAIAEPFVGKMMAQQTIFDALSTVVAPEHLKGVQRFASEDLFRGRGVAAIIGVAVLLYTGSRVFVELDDSFDVIWRGNSPRHIHIVLATLKSRLLALLLMVVLGVLLIVVILLSVLLSAYAGVLQAFPILGQWIGPAISGLTHYGILAVFFTLIYKWLPTGGVPWRFALISGGVNAVLFLAGNRALVYYFEVTQLTSAFGATAGFAAIMVWMYWTALTILIGAQVGRATRDAFDSEEPHAAREVVQGDIDD